jgi:prevent-host-death family protein
MGLQQPHEVGIRELRQHASRYVAWVRDGHELIVTSHGKPAARLVPIADTAEDSVEAMIRSGELIGPEELGDPLDVPIVVPSSTAPTSQQILDEIREDRL